MGVHSGITGDEGRYEHKAEWERGRLHASQAPATLQMCKLKKIKQISILHQQLFQRLLSILCELTECEE